MVIPLKDPKFSPKETQRRMPNPDPEEVAKAFRECCQDKNMGQPLSVYTDAGNEFQSKFDKVCESNEWLQPIKHIKVIWAKAAYAESFVYSMKLFFLQKVKNKELTNWSSLCETFTEQWNTEPRPILKVGGITFSPVAIHKEVPMNIIGMLKEKLMMKALNNKGEFPRYYEPLEVGDRVRYYTAGRGNDALTKKFYNQGLYRWSKDPATIAEIKHEDGLTWYRLQGIDSPLWWLRFQLMAQHRKPRPQ